ncbi:hypothetical protein CK203_067105 [Vitis vinifera]|uniref:Uncharacterized protein n=1 Tax=Vitis vinifera TaxID=29760 RepID=A0A438F538_VITVI|nr:hypothetical protein CK203_067105 [Vitis vinifera]
MISDDDVASAAERRRERVAGSEKKASQEVDRTPDEKRRKVKSVKKRRPQALPRSGNKNALLPGSAVTQSRLTKNVTGFSTAREVNRERLLMLTSEAPWVPRPTVNSTETISKMEDPFVVLESTSTHVVLSPGVFTDPLGEINKLSSSGGKKVGGSSAANGKMFGDDPLSSLGKSVAAFSSEMNKRGRI